MFPQLLHRVWPTDSPINPLSAPHAQVTVQALGGVRAKPGQRQEEPNLIEVLADASLIGNEVLLLASESSLLPPSRLAPPTSSFFIL
jgi:hypothetical protein